MTQKPSATSRSPATTAPTETLDHHDRRSSAGTPLVLLLVRTLLARGEPDSPPVPRARLSPRMPTDAAPPGAELHSATRRDNWAGARECCITRVFRDRVPRAIPPFPPGEIKMTMRSCAFAF